jgi:hypothetical protein
MFRPVVALVVVDETLEEVEAGQRPLVRLV